MSIKIASWNVNGLRACIQKGFFDWVQKEKPDIIGLQETKAQESQLEICIEKLSDYELYYASAEKKGYSGVALFSRKSSRQELTLTKITHGLDCLKFDREGRTLIAEYPNFVVVNSYYPNGQRDHNRVPYKLEYSRLVVEKALKLHQETKKPIILMGDFNTAHHEIDLANPKANQKTTGFLPIERAWMDELTAQGFNDVFRLNHPEEAGHYTWWTYRSGCRARNIGWRIDYFFTTQDLLKKIKSTSIQSDVLGSDHCPIILELK